jgi:hypothetical protein
LRCQVFHSGQQTSQQQEEKSNVALTSHQTSVTVRVGRLLLIRFQIHPNLSRPLVALSSSPKEEEEEEEEEEDSAPVIFILVSRYFRLSLVFNNNHLKYE